MKTRQTDRECAERHLTYPSSSFTTPSTDFPSSDARSHFRSSRRAMATLISLPHFLPLFKKACSWADWHLEAWAAS